MSTGGQDLRTSAEVRDRLIEEARRVVKDLGSDRQATKQAATAQAVLLRGGLAELERALEADFDGGGTAEHWRRFRKAFRPRLEAIKAAHPDAPAASVGFTLGWIRRLGEIAAATATRPPRAPAPKRSAPR